MKDRRLVEARATLTGTPGKPLGFLARPTLGAVGWADLRQPHALPTPHLVRPDIRDKVAGDWHAAHAELTLYPHPGEELGCLGTIAATDAAAGWIGITVAGALDAAP